jgi:hypothetical protein
MPLTILSQCDPFWLMIIVPPSLFLLSGAVLLLASCGAMSGVRRPIGDGAFDPLTGPGISSGNSSVDALSHLGGVSYQPGQWVETSMPNSAFFREIPKGNATADKILQAGAPLKYISSKGIYLKVELESGDVGFVPEIMVADRSALPAVPVLPGGAARSNPPVADDEGFAPPVPAELPGATLPGADAVPVLPAVPPAPALPVAPPVVPDFPEPPKVEGVTD